MIRDYDIVDSENGIVREIRTNNPSHYPIKDLFNYNLVNIEIMPRGWGEYMTIKDNIKEELLSMISSERGNLEKRLEMHGDIFEISCEENFLNKLEKFVESI